MIVIVDERDLVKEGYNSLFGREGDGLTNQELELCDLVVSIPTHESYPILNITHAAAIIFYELFKTQKKYPVENLDEASLEEKKGLIDYADEVLDKLDYPPHKKKVKKDKKSRYADINTASTPSAPAFEGVVILTIAISAIAAKMATTIKNLPSIYLTI